jgi:CheY-like chemotaxis protein
MNRKILLVEDNEQNRYRVTFLLQPRGWEIVHRERCFQSGCNGYLEKPIDPEGFGVAVENFLEVGNGGEKP